MLHSSLPVSCFPLTMASSCRQAGTSCSCIRPLAALHISRLSSGGVVERSPHCRRRPATQKRQKSSCEFMRVSDSVGVCLRVDAVMTTLQPTKLAPRFRFPSSPVNADPASPSTALEKSEKRVSTSVKIIPDNFIALLQVPVPASQVVVANMCAVATRAWYLRTRAVPQQFGKQKREWSQQS